MTPIHPDCVIPNSHPGKPTKAVYEHCPACHDIATTLVSDSRGLHCPNCGWKNFESHEVLASDPEPDTNMNAVLESVVPSVFICVNCGKRVYPVGTADSDASKSLGYLNSDNQLRCRQHSQEFIEHQPAMKQTLDHLLPPQELIGGMAHSVGTPPFHLIPAIALIELANQYALGERIKGKDAWNALSNNQHVLQSKEALAVRLGHVISHATVMLDALTTNKPLNIRDAAAIMWGGSFAICAAKAQTCSISPPSK